MNAELVLYLFDQGLTIAAARKVAETEPANVPELTLALIEFGEVTLATARGMAEEAPLTPSKPVIKPQNASLPPAVQTALQADAPIRPRYVPVVDADGLTAKQRAALDRGVGLCANCQQPRNAHLPGCSVASGENPRAITKDRLPPAV